MRSSLSKWLKFNGKLHFESLAVLSVWFNSSPLQPHEAHGSLLWPQPASLFSWQHQNIRMDSAYSSVHIVQRVWQIQDRGTVLLDVFHWLLEELPCVLLLEIFALGRWLLTGGHSVSLGVQDDDKQMVCSDLCIGGWYGDTAALMAYDRWAG